MSVCAQRSYPPTTQRVYTAHSEPLTFPSPKAKQADTGWPPKSGSEAAQPQPAKPAGPSTFGYNVVKWDIERGPPTRANALRVRTPEVKVARNHSGTMTNARFPEEFSRDLTFRDPRKFHRTLWYEHLESLQG